MKKHSTLNILKKISSLKTLLFFLIITPALIISIQILSADESFSILTFRHSITKKEGLRVLLDTTIEAQEKNLAIISVPLTAGPKPIDGNLTLKIREENKADWLHTATYSGILAIRKEQLFGFPPIENSKFINYEIQVLLDSRNGLLFKVDHSRPIRSKYKYNRELISKDCSSIVKFIFRKFTFTIQNNPYFIFTAFVYWLPSIALIILLTGEKKLIFLYNYIFYSKLSKSIKNDNHTLISIVKSNKYRLVSIIVFLSTLIEIFIFAQYDDALSTLALSLLWLLLIIKGAISIFEVTIMTLAMIVLTQISFALLFLSSNLPQKAGSWVFILLTITLLSNIYFLKKDNTNF